MSVSKKDDSLASRLLVMNCSVSWDTLSPDVDDAWLFSEPEEVSSLVLVIRLDAVCSPRKDDGASSAETEALAEEKPVKASEEKS